MRRSIGRLLAAACGSMLALGTVPGPAPAATRAASPAPPDTLHLTLGACVERALAVGEEMRIAEADLEAAHGIYVQARSDVFPRLALASSYTRQFESVFRREGGIDVQPFEPDTTAPLENRVRALEDALPTAPLASLSGLFDSFASRNTWNVSLGLTQKVFEGKSLWAAVQVARHALGSFESRRDDRQSEVTMQVREAYLAALLADRGVQIAELGLQQAETQLRRVRLRQEAGQAAEYDLLQAEVQRDNQLPIVKQARNARQVAYLHLCAVANLPERAPLALATPLLGDAALPADPLAVVDTVGLAQEALQSSGISALEEEVAARRANVTVAGRDYWPALSLFANYSKQAFPSDVWPSRGEWRTDANAGLRLSWSIFDGMRTRGAVHQSRALATIAERSLEQGREGVRLVVARELGELERAAADLHARSRTVQLAKRALELATLRYDEGMSSLLEVEDARTAYQVAQGSEARARYDYFVALAHLERYSERPLFTSLARSLGGE